MCVFEITWYLRGYNGEKVSRKLLTWIFTGNRLIRTCGTYETLALLLFSLLLFFGIIVFIGVCVSFFICVNSVCASAYVCVPVYTCAYVSMHSNDYCRINL